MPAMPCWDLGMQRKVNKLASFLLQKNQYRLLNSGQAFTNIKGRLISKGLFSIHEFFKKKKRMKKFDLSTVQKKNSFVSFLEESLA